MFHRDYNNREGKRAGRGGDGREGGEGAMTSLTCEVRLFFDILFPPLSRRSRPLLLQISQQSATSLDWPAVNS